MFSSLLYTRSWQAVPPLRLDQSVYPAELSAPPSLWASDQFPTPNPSPTHWAPSGSRPPLGADTLGIHDRTPGAPGFLNILFTRHPASSSSPPRVSLRCLSLYLFILHAPFSRLRLRLSIDILLPLQFEAALSSSDRPTLFILHRPIVRPLSSLFLSLIARIYLG